MSPTAQPPGEVRRWTAACPAIDPLKILRLHGYKDTLKVRPVIRKIAAEMAAAAPPLVDTACCWRRVGVEAYSGGALRLAGGASLACAAFGRWLEDASEVVVFVLTLGERFDASVAALSQGGEPLKALFLETAGRLAVEKLTRSLAADIGRDLSKEGLSLGTRLGPGYSYRLEGQPAEERVEWPLEQQRELIALFGEYKPPVELLDSAVMLPKMSRSGLFGVEKTARS